ncbi:MAG: sulfate ABC transporter substrate-binding protein [Pseudomonadota bacterium]|nr:sulfate ABC transporter substrate-binding protein [Pseudomonadota bacterium]
MRIALVLACLLSMIPCIGHADPVELLNVSYDPTREFYDEFNKSFTAYWKQKSGQQVTIAQSHGGSGKQARAVIDGLKADVATLALAYDIDMIAEKGHLLPHDWQTQFPHNSCPYTSTVVFLVHKGNPKQIHDWDDLVKDGVQVVTPNPKTSGGARWNYLAAWAYAKNKFGGDEKKAMEFMGRLYKNVPVLDTGARGASVTFVQRGIGDVLVGWENEAFLAEQQAARGEYEIVRPSISILAEPPVAIIEKNASRKGTLELARAYLEYLYTPQAQELAAKYYYRPVDEAVAAKFAGRFPPMQMATIADFGGWEAAQKKHFDDGGTFDQIYGK